MVRPYAELRAAIEQKDRGFREKVMSLSDAIGLIQDGDVVGVGGCHYSRTPMAAIWEIIRQRKQHLSFARSITSTEGDLLLASGVSQHIISSWFSAGVTWGVSRVMRHYTQNGLAKYEEWSHMTLGLRFRAGALGVPFIPARSMIGSDLIGQLDGLKTMDCPYTGDPLALVPALNPNVALIHVQRCDAYGNAQFDGLPFMDRDLALAADKVIITTEQIISNDQVRRRPDATEIPFMCVAAVVEVPYGSLPHECYGLYEPDFGHMDYYVSQVTGGGLEGAQQYLERYVYGPKTWADYLELIGLKAILQASAAGRSIYGD